MSKIKIRRQRIIFSILFLMVLSFEGFSQKSAFKHPGFVITLKGEKIKGKFKLFYPKGKEELLSILSTFEFRADQKSQKRKSSQTNLQYVEYTILGTKTKRTYDRKKVTFLNGTTRSLLLPPPTIKGAINLYAVKTLASYSGPFNTIMENLDETIYIEKDDKIYCAINRYLKKNLFSLIKGCPELAKKYDTTVYNYRNPETVVKAYNECMK